VSAPTLDQPSLTFSHGNSFMALEFRQPSEFRQFEYSGWQAIPDKYHSAFGHLTTQAIQPLLDAVRVKEGDKFLDIASGPGYVAAAAAQRGAVVVGVDFSEAMIGEARRLYPDVEFRQGDAETLPFGNGLFDAAVMNFGILHLDKPDQALAEAHRVLRSGGRFAFTVWAKPEETIGFGIVLRAVEKYGHADVSLPPGPPFFRFSEPAEASRAMSAAGFDSLKVDKVEQLWRLPAGDGLFDAMRDGTVRTAGLLRAQNPEAMKNIRQAIQEETERYTKGSLIELPMPAILASARKT
jgi:ubiquinone/menaquinone biosynthesis C-methylase UbiE